MVEHKYLYNYFGSAECLEGPQRLYYICSFQNLNKIVKSEIELTKAKHIHGKGKRSVDAVVISNSITHYIPSKIGDHFLCLRALEITGCALRMITKDDLPSNIDFKELWLSDNCIESLPADLFENTPWLEILSFRNNKIKFISEQTLRPLRRLKFADFRGNVNINVIYKSGDSLPDSLTLLSTLQAKIFFHCNDEQVASTVTSYVHNLWQGEFSDFNIRAGSETFKVHKNVLAVNSPVFAAMFSHGMQENLNSEITINNFSSESIKEFLAFIYLRQIPKKCFNAVDLYAMSMQYQVKELSTFVQWFIIDEVNVENASEMFKLGGLYDNKNIKEAAFEAIEKFFNKKLPAELMESVGMLEILEAKDNLDAILKRNLQSIRQSKLILQTGSCEIEGKTEPATECKNEPATECKNEPATECKNEPEQCENVFLKC